MTPNDAHHGGEPFADGRPRPLDGLGPAALVLPVLSALAIGLFATQRRQAPAPPAAAFAAPDEIEVEAWVGRVPLAGDAGRVELRLTPLQSDARRQAFDRDRLAERLGLGAGEPWRLEVRYDAAEDGAGSEAAVRLARPSIADRDGVACSPLEPGVDDPLATLLRTPEALELAAGETVQVVLWGRGPDGAPRALGLSTADGPLECALSSLVVPESDVPASVARRR